jgi:hypothetical protein
MLRAMSCGYLVGCIVPKAYPELGERFPRVPGLKHRSRHLGITHEPSLLCSAHIMHGRDRRSERERRELAHGLEEDAFAKTSKTEMQ